MISTFCVSILFQFVGDAAQIVVDISDDLGVELAADVRHLDEGTPVAAPGLRVLFDDEIKGAQPFQALGNFEVIGGLSLSDLQGCFEVSFDVSFEGWRIGLLGWLFLRVVLLLQIIKIKHSQPIEKLGLVKHARSWRLEGAAVLTNRQSVLQSLQSCVFVARC